MKKLITTFLLASAICLPACAIFGLKKSLPDISLLKAELKGDLNAVKMENAKLSSQITGLRFQVKDLDASLKANISNIVGINNKLSTVQSDIKSGRDTIQGSGNVNDKELMQDYIKSLKENSKQQGKTYERVIVLLIGQMAILITLLGWAMKKSMTSGDDDDRFKERMLERKITEQKMDDKIEISKKEASNV